jgi:hypothetical protein
MIRLFTEVAYETTREAAMGRSLRAGGGNSPTLPLAWPHMPLLIFALLMFTMIARGFRNEDMV